MRSKFVFCPTCIVGNYLTPNISHMYSMGMGVGFYLFIYLFRWGSGGFGPSVTKQSQK
jgi:hypothetical protein